MQKKTVITIFWGVYYKNIIVKSQEYLYESFVRIVTYVFPLSASPTNSTWNVSSHVLPSSHGITSKKWKFHISSKYEKTEEYSIV